jgi:hypothetical protein
VDLTICIPHTTSRASLLSRLLWCIQQQAWPPLEVIVHGGRGPMGDKLNEMFAQAQGEYIVCVDDDDLLDGNFSSRLYEGGKGRLAMATRTDFIGYRILALRNGCYWLDVAHDISRDPSCTWQGTDRGVSPKCLIRTTIARKHTFGNHYTADREWSRNVQRDVRTHTFIDAPLYVYDWWPDHMLGTHPDDHPDRPQRDVGQWPYDPELVRWLT